MSIFQQKLKKQTKNKKVWPIQEKEMESRQTVLETEAAVVLDKAFESFILKMFKGWKGGVEKVKEKDMWKMKYR